MPNNFEHRVQLIVERVSGIITVFDGNPDGLDDYVDILARNRVPFSVTPIDDVKMLIECINTYMNGLPIREIRYK